VPAVKLSAEVEAKAVGSNLIFGEHIAEGFALDGKIDESVVLARPLTATEVAAQY